MNSKNSFLLELFRECNKDEVFEQYSAEVDVGFQEHGDTLLILFEPSDGSVDWRHNFTFFRKPYHDMEIPYYVHGGFLKCWRIVKDVVIAKLHERLWKHVVITGYSHGGALALLAHECAWFELPQLRNGRIITVAFEAPRIYGGFEVNDEIAGRWNNAYVIRTNKDLVTHMPPRFVGFCDVGQMLQINTQEKQGCISSHSQKWVQRALLNKVNRNTLAPVEAALMTTDLWK